MPLRDLTDYARLDAATDEDIARDMAADPDLAPECDETWFAAATLVLPDRKRQHTLRLDAEIIAHFRALGPRWQTRINAVLKRYVQAQKPK